nr:hypothetical protein 22 [bacterium]
MTKTTVTQSFNGVKDGEVYPVTFQPGDEVTGQLAEIAVKEGWAVQENQTQSNAQTNAPKNKAQSTAPSNRQKPTNKRGRKQG